MSIHSLFDGPATTQIDTYYHTLPLHGALPSYALLQPGNVIARIGHPAVERHMLARIGGLLPDEGVDIGDKLGRRAVAKGADAVDEERLALWKNGRHRKIGRESCRERVWMYV